MALDKSKPYGTIYGDQEGRAFEQDGKYFESSGKPWAPEKPAEKAPAKPAAKPVDAVVEDQLAKQRA